MGTSERQKTLAEVGRGIEHLAILLFSLGVSLPGTEIPREWGASKKMGLGAAGYSCSPASEDGQAVAY